METHPIVDKSHKLKCQTFVLVAAMLLAILVRSKICATAVAGYERSTLSLAARTNKRTPIHTEVTEQSCTRAPQGDAVVHGFVGRRAYHRPRVCCELSHCAGEACMYSAAVRERWHFLDCFPEAPPFSTHIFLCVTDTFAYALVVQTRGPYKNFSSAVRALTGFAGEPKATTSGGRSHTTTAPAPTTVCSPMVFP